MPWLLNVIYLFALALLSPWLLWRTLRTGRYRKDLLPKLTGRVPMPPAGPGPVIWFHAVSVGEVHLLDTVIKAYLQRHPSTRVVVSSTTDTGLAEARNRFGNHTVIPFPFDFSWAVHNAIRILQPAIIVLAEGELWPNLVRIANGKNIPVAIINGRLSPKSFQRYKKVAGVARWLLLNQISRFAVQDEAYATRYSQLGIPPEKLKVTGSVKYDGATGVKDTPKARALAEWMNATAPILVAGSTHAPEEQYILAAFQTLKQTVPTLRLILVPRHPDRFSEVAKMLTASGVAFAKRSTDTKGNNVDVILLDTIGELGAAWSLATVGFVGGTLDGHRGGQSMIEPAAYGVPTVFGPHVWNFRDAARRLVEANGAVMVQKPEELAHTLLTILTNEILRHSMSQAAALLVKQQQGATAKTLDLLDELLTTAPQSRRAVA